MFLKFMSTSRALPTWCQSLHTLVWTKLGQIWDKSGPNSQFLKKRPETLALCMFLRIPTTTSAYIRLFELTTVTEWVNWTKNGPNIGPKWFNHYRLLTSIANFARRHLHYYFQIGCTLAMTGVISCGCEREHRRKVAQKTVGKSKWLHHTLMVHPLESHVFFWFFCYLFCYIKEDSQAIQRFCLV